jgi:hypothetical protein
MSTKTLDELLDELLRTGRDSRPVDSQATQDARKIRAEILRRFGDKEEQ